MYEAHYASARQAQIAWAARPITERAQRLHRVADLLLSRTELLADQIVAENGKPRVEAIAHDIGGSIDAVRWACRNATRLLHDQPVRVPYLPHRTLRTRHRPFGVVLVISPWNFPLAIPLSQVVAGLLAGNAVVLKPSEYAPNVGACIGELLHAAGVPDGLVTVVQGDGATGAALIDARPDKVFFTGSVATGRKVMAQAARFPIPVSLELGGIDAMIVCDDADIEQATSAALWGALFNHGQVCASVERLLIDARVYDRFMARFDQKLTRLDPMFDQGRVTMPRQGRIYDQQLVDARARGLTVRAGGEWRTPQQHLPTVIEGPGIEASAVYQEESFGPIVAVTSFGDDAEAIHKHNATDFGLTASVFTGDPARGARIAGALNAGLVSVNEVAATLYAFGALPWGGKGASGFGRSHGAEGLMEFTWPQVLDQPRTIAGRDPLAGVKRPWWFPYDPAQLRLMTHFNALIGGTSLWRRGHAAAQATRALLTMLVQNPRI